MGAWTTWSNRCHTKWRIAPASYLQSKTAELQKVMTTPNELAFHERIHDLRFRPFAQVGLTKVSSPQNQTYPTCIASLKTNFWHTSDITNLQELDGQCYLCYSGDGAVAGHEWCWPGLPRRHGPHWTWIRGDHSVHSISMSPCLRGGIERAIPQQSKTGIVWFKALRNIMILQNCKHCKLSRFKAIPVSLWACLHSFILCSKKVMSMLPTTKTSKNPQLDSGCITRGDQVCLEGVQDGLPDGELGGNESPSLGWLHGMVRLHIYIYDKNILLFIYT